MYKQQTWKISTQETFNKQAAAQADNMTKKKATNNLSANTTFINFG